MTADFETWCSAAVADLVANVGALSGVTTHILAPWSPEDRVAQERERHLAVWPDAELGEQASRLMLGADEVEQVFLVAYWEHAGTESERQALDVAATSALFDLQNAIRARFYRQAFSVSGYYRNFYRGTKFPDRSGRIRGFEMEVAATTAVAFT